MAQPTMQQVAEKAGVSTALVSLVMRGAPNVSDYRRELVLVAADELGYRPNVLARNLASRRTQTIGVVLNDLHNPFFAEIVDGVQDAADAAGYRILLGNGGKSKVGEAHAIETFLQFRVDGLVIAGAQLATAVMETAAATTAVAVIGRTPRTKKLDTVNNDEAIGAKLAVDHLVELGHRGIAHVGGGTGAGAAARRKGYEAAMTEHGLAEHITIASADYTEAGGYAAAQTLLDSDRVPTAIFGANDLSAVGALDCIEDAGLRAPDDMSIVGYDNTALAAMRHMSLTTINQPTEDFGRFAMNLLFERLDDGRTEAVHHVVPPTLVVRSSSGPPAS